MLVHAIKIPSPDDFPCNFSFASFQCASPSGFFLSLFYSAFRDFGKGSSRARTLFQVIKRQSRKTQLVFLKPNLKIGVNLCVLLVYNRDSRVLWFGGVM